MTVEQLRTPKDVSRVREQMYKDQGGIDPIVQEHIAMSDSVLDHDHDSQHTRAALHRQCNVFEGVLRNSYIRCLRWWTDKPLPDILRNLATYYEKDFTSNPLHPGAMKRGLTEFRKMNVAAQKKLLASFNKPVGINKTEREYEFKKIQKQFSFQEIMVSIDGSTAKSDD